jgi:hypothetical protein
LPHLLPWFLEHIVRYERTALEIEVLGQHPCFVPGGRGGGGGYVSEIG